MCVCVRERERERERKRERESERERERELSVVWFPCINKQELLTLGSWMKGEGCLKVAAGSFRTA